MRLAKPVTFGCCLFVHAASTFAANGIFAGGSGQAEVFWAPTSMLTFRVIPNDVDLIVQNMAIDTRGTRKMYWGASREIRRSNFDGSGLEVLVSNASGYDGVWGTAVDMQNQVIYWTDVRDCDGADSGIGGIRRANLDGSGVQTINANAHCARSITVDTDAGKIYWTEEGRGVYRSNLNGSQVELLVSYIGQYVAAYSIKIDRAAGKMYWISETWFDPEDIEYSGIHRANLDGSEVENLYEGYVRSLAIDLADAKIYWTQETPEGRQLRRSNFDGSNVEDITEISPTGFLYIAMDDREPSCTRTAMYGDITNLQGSVEFGDIAAVVDAFRGEPSVDATLCDLFPCDLGGNRCMGDGVIDFRDISQVVNAFRGMYTCPQ